MNDFQKAVGFFVNKGWTAPQATGIVSNLQAESGLNPSITGDSGKALGIAQWHPPRQKAFEQAMGKSMKGSSFEDQLAFVHHELTAGTEKRAGEALRKAADAGSAADIFTRLYERPKNVDADAAKRAAMATQAYAKLNTGTLPAAKPPAAMPAVDQMGNPTGQPLAKADTGTVPMSTAQAAATAMQEINQGLPPGSLLSPQQSPGAQSLAALQALQQNNTSQLAATAQAEPSDWENTDVLQAAKSQAAKNQERLMASMFSDTGGEPPANDTSQLPGAVDRYLDKVLAS